MALVAGSITELPSTSVSMKSTIELLKPTELPTTELVQGTGGFGGGNSCLRGCPTAVALVVAVVALSAVVALVVGTSRNVAVIV